MQPIASKRTVITPADPTSTPVRGRERVDDVMLVQLEVQGFTDLARRERMLAWHLHLAALAGRDIYYDQRYVHALDMRAILEEILTHGSEVEPSVLGELQRYTKLFWIHSGPYNGLTARKFVLALTREQLLTAVRSAARAGASFPARAGETLERLVERVAPLFLDEALDPVLTSKTPPAGQDILEASANNLYEGVTTHDLAGFDERYGLNSRLVNEGGRLIEEVYRVGGRYDGHIRRIVRHLEGAIPHAPAALAEALRALVRFYQTGERADRVAYDIASIRSRQSPVDTINGFIELYLDPRGTKGTWESLVYVVNQDKTRRIESLAAHAQWFEDHMPWDPRFSKREARGVTARSVDLLVASGAAGPLAPMGINLPNDQSIREAYGSRSLLLSNVAEAIHGATPEEMHREFAWSDEEAERATRWGALAQQLTAEMHEVIGHGSGRMADGITTAPHLLLKEHYSAVEEARADLVALYFLADPEVVRLGITAPERHTDIVLTSYEYYVRTTLTQLRRLRGATQLESDHMRARQMIVTWLAAHTPAVEIRTREGKTYFVMTDAQAFRQGIGRLLADVQRIKGDGDYEGARDLLEGYGVHIDVTLRDEAVARSVRLDLPSYTAFVMPRLHPTYASDGTLLDVHLSYPHDFQEQMLEYSALGAASRER